MIEEIGDVQQFIDDLCQSVGMTQEELRHVVKKKSDRKGSFSQGEYIESVTIPNQDDKWAKYCRQSPDK